MSQIRSELDDRIATVTACAALASGSSNRQRDVALSTQEWNCLARWLVDTERRPADLLFSTIFDCLTENELDSRIVRKASSIPDRASDALDEMNRLQGAGIWTLCRADDAFPRRWKEHLGSAAPPVIFGAGSLKLLDDRSVSIVGSRSVSGFLAELAGLLGTLLAQSGLTTVSGAAQGTDRFGMLGALEAKGRSTGVLPGNLRRHAAQDDLQRYISDDQLCLLSHVHPNTGFLPGNAMARNRLIYALSELTIVVSSTEGSGGTWAGAVENLKRGKSPIAVWTGEEAPPANHAIAELGAFPFDGLPANEKEVQKLILAAQTHFQVRKT